MLVVLSELWGRWRSGGGVCVSKRRECVSLIGSTSEKREIESHCATLALNGANNSCSLTSQNVGWTKGTFLRYG